MMQIKTLNLFLRTFSASYFEREKYKCYNCYSTVMSLWGHVVSLSFYHGNRLTMMMKSKTFSLD